MHKTKIVNPPTRFLLDYFNIDFRSEVPHIDEIRYGKQHVLKEVMKLADKIKILSQHRIKPFIPIVAIGTGTWVYPGMSPCHIRIQQCFLIPQYIELFAFLTMASRWYRYPRSNLHLW